MPNPSNFNKRGSRSLKAILPCGLMANQRRTPSSEHALQVLPNSSSRSSSNPLEVLHSLELVQKYLPLSSNIIHCYYKLLHPLPLDVCRDTMRYSRPSCVRVLKGELEKRFALKLPKARRHSARIGSPYTTCIGKHRTFVLSGRMRMTRA